MGTLVQETDIDHFIRGHKTQLQEEKAQLNQFGDQSRYPAGQQVTSPSGRRQWDRNRGPVARPAEEKRAPVEPEETGLPLSFGEQEKKKQQLQSERHQEYNDMLAQRGQKFRRQPRTPTQEGLPLGQYETRRRAYEAERQKEMKEAMETKRGENLPKGHVFDYHEAEKTHMAEKRKEYNEYLDKKKLQQKRHVATPEDGMFIGPDQSQRDKEIREKSRKNRQALEEQQREQLLFKARQHGQIPEHTPRRGKLSKDKQQPAVLYKPPPPPTPPPARGQRPDQGQGRDIEERVMDMPKISPRRNEPVRPEPRVAFAPEQEANPKRLPIYMEDGKGHYQGHQPTRDQGRADYHRDEARDRRRENQLTEPRDLHDLRLELEKAQDNPDYERRGHRKKFDPPLEVRRSRSLSPPAERHRHSSPEELLDEQRRMIEKLNQTPPDRQRATWDARGEETQGQPSVPPGELYRLAKQQKVQRMYEEQMAERQQILQHEYRREIAEEQRLASEREGLPIGASNRQKLGDERNREYNEYLAKNEPQRSFRVKEPTPEHLRLGLPLDQGKYNEKKRQLETERQREYNDLIQKQQQLEYEKQQQLLQQQQQYQKQQQEQQQQQYREQPGPPTAAPAGKYYTQNQQAQSYENYEKGPKGSRRADVLEGSGATLPVGEYDDSRRQQLLSERSREYNEHQQQKLATQRNKGLPPKPPTPNHFFKSLGQHDRQKEMLNEERKKEYNQKLTQERGRTGRSNYGGEQDATGLAFKNPDSAEVRLGKDVYATLPGLHYTESAEARKLKTRNEEYNEFLREKQWKDAHRFDKKKPPTAASRRHSEPSSPRGKKEFATLPGLHYSDSAEKRKMQERNREYNDFLRQKDGGKKGWATPTYEDILEQKRREEAFRRQDDDFEQPGMRRYASEGAINRLQNDFRERELDKEFDSRKVRFDDEFKTQQGGILEDDNWLNPEQKREQEYKQLAEQPPRSDLQDEMAARVRQAPFLASLPVGGAPGLGVGQDERDSAKKRRQSDYRKELELQMQEAKAARRREKVQELRVNASGLLDPEKTSNRVRGLEGQPGISPRREYRAKEVQPYHTKFLLDDSGDFDALGRRANEYTYSAPPYGGQMGRNQGGGSGGLGDISGLGLGSADHDVLGQRAGAQPSTAPPLRGILSNADVQSGDGLQLDLGGGGGGRERGRRREREPALLDPGFAGLLDARRPIKTSPPPGLMYQPSTYVTGGGGVGGPYSSIDEAYHYYGMKNPLDIDTNGGGGSGIPNLNLGGDYGGGGGGGGNYRGSPTPRVTFADGPPSTTRLRDRSKERIAPYQFPSDDDFRSKSRSETQNYGAELERQIQEKRMQKMREKEEQDRYERRLEQEVATYNPFGRGGGGAPIKDEHGHAIADLRSVQKGTYQSPRGQQSPRGHVSPTFSPRPPSPRDDKIRAPPPQQTAFGDATYARGGHGIFGQPKTEAEKDQSDKYKDDLRDQIAEKRQRDRMEKERERMEEQKENQRLEDQRQRMQTEYEEEQKKIRAREEETRRKNEELKKQADDKKKEADRKRREADDARMRDQQEQMDREKRDREEREAAAHERLKSPPVPALKVKYPPGQYHYTFYQTNEERGKSPPVPAHRRGRDSAASNRSRTSQRVQQSPAPGPSADRPQSSDVLTQLASMRKQLQNERKRVETALEQHKNEPDVFDARLVQRPPPVKREMIERNKLIFENAVNKNASLPPPRAQTTDMANARNIQKFNELKFKNDTESRKAFRSMFPDAPLTNTTLEAQQDAMLRQQEEQLRSLRERSHRPSSAPINFMFIEEKAVKIENTILSDPYDPTPSNMSFGRGRGNVSARSQLASNSAFIDVEGVNHFPEDFEDMAGARNDSARARRRDRYTTSPRVNNDMGSQASLDIDRIQRKNEERLRRLNNMSTTAGDEISMADPDDILERFMAKQRYNRGNYSRPPSGQTLQDDSWLRPGSKVV